jgi:hypothetical protein
MLLDIGVALVLSIVIVRLTGGADAIYTRRETAGVSANPFNWPARQHCRFAWYVVVLCM